MPTAPTIDPFVSLPTGAYEKFGRSKVFEGIEEFATDLMSTYHMEWTEARAPEVRSGILLTYCAKHALDSMDTFNQCVCLFHRAQKTIAPLMDGDPGSFGNHFPTWCRLSSCAAFAIAKGCRMYLRDADAMIFENTIQPMQDTSEATGKSLNAGQERFRTHVALTASFSGHWRSEADILKRLLDALRNDTSLEVSFFIGSETSTAFLPSHSSEVQEPASSVKPEDPKGSQVPMSHLSTFRNSYNSGVGLNLIADWSRWKPSYGSSDID